MSELTDLCAELDYLASHLGQQVEQLNGLARTLEREAEGLRAQFVRSSGPEGRAGQDAVNSLVSAARASETSAREVAAAARAGADYARRNASGQGGGVTPTRQASPEGGRDGGAATGEAGRGAALSSEPVTNDQLGPYVQFEGSVPLDAATVATSWSHQGALGDCGLVAACDGLLRKDPGAVASAVTENADGTYTVALHPGAGEGRTNVHTLSASAPARAARSHFGGHGADLVAWSWVTLVEKAFAADRGSYTDLKGIDPGQVLTALTGKSYRYGTAPGLETIATMLQRGPVIVATKLTLSPSPFGRGPSRREADVRSVVERHWYSVVAVRESVSPTGTAYEVVLANPWGVGTRDATAYLCLDEASFLECFAHVCYEEPFGGRP